MNIYRKSQVPPRLLEFFEPAEIGLEPTPDEYVAEIVAVFAELRRVLRSDGTAWLNLGDSYNSGAEIGRHEARENPSEFGTTHKFLGTKRQYGKRQSDLKPKDLFGIPWRVAFALQADGWYLRQDIIWSKPNPMPESVTDRCTKAHEYLFMLSKSPRYFYDADAISERASSVSDGGKMHEGTKSFETQNGGKKSSTLGVVRRAKDDAAIARPPNSRPHNLSKFEAENDRSYGTRNKRSVWEIATQPYAGAHFATFPPALIEPCIKAGCPPGGTVLDPFGGAGTTGLVADRLQRNAILIELNPEYAAMSQRRIRNEAGIFAEVQMKAPAA